MKMFWCLGNLGASNRFKVEVVCVCREPLVLAIGLCEAYRVSVGWANPSSEQFNTLREDYAPGELGFDVSFRRLGR